MSTVVQDLKYGLRTLARNPGFTLVAVLTLALGIGANTAIFSVVYGVLLGPLPYRNPGQLVQVIDDLRGLNLQNIGMSVPELEDLRDRSGIFEQVSAIWPISANLTGTDHPERVEAVAVSPTYFTLLGAHAQVGRLFGAEDALPGFSEGIVISDGLWRRLFAADANVLGKKLRLDNDLYTVIGVAPREFRHPAGTLRSNEVEVWASCGFSSAPFGPRDRRQNILPGAIARLKPGLSVEQAQERLDAFGNQLSEQYPNDYPAKAAWTLRVVPLHEHLVGNVRPTLLVLFAAVGFVLLIGCANIANLLLARSTVRQREIAIRRALGAPRGRVIRQMLTESVLLSSVAGMVGIGTAFASVHLLLNLLPSKVLRVTEVGINASVLVFAFLISVVTGLVFGLAPAIQTSNPNLVDNLKEGARGLGSSSRQGRLRSLLVVSEVALSVVLMIGAGLLIRSFWRLLKVDLGFDAQNVLVAETWLPVPNDPKTDPYAKAESRTAFVREVLRRVNTLPGVQASAVTSNIPFGSTVSMVPFATEGSPVLSSGNPTAHIAVLSPDYFHVMGTPLIQGRFLIESDGDKAPRAVLVDQTMARRFWPNQDPVGKRLRFLQPKDSPWMTIVGIVGNIKTDRVDGPGSPHVYLSIYQFNFRAVRLVLRTTAAPTALENAVRQEIQAVDPQLPVFGVRTMKEVVAGALAQRRFSAQLIGLFAAAALLLAGIGIYGLIAYTVNQRSREIGVRMALGAQPGEVLKLVIHQGLRLTLIGVVIGLVASLALTNLMSSLLYGVHTTDAVTLISVPLSLIAVALLACYIPARRATRVGPMVALRSE